jgi:uncharacterized protein (TIGR02217 family)
MNSFSESRFDLGIHYGITSTYRYSTHILANAQGQEQRNANWSQPLAKYQIDSKSLTRSELDTLIQFHLDRQGAYEGFRFRDWVDYSTTHQIIGTGDGIQTQFQLVKTYVVDGYFVGRPILKPLPNLTLYNDGIWDNAWVLDTETGVLTFDTPPVLGATLAADFEFDVPVRFETDQINFRFEAYEDDDTAIFTLDSTVLVEDRLSIDSLPVPPSPIAPILDHLLDLGIDYGTLGGNRYSTEITPISSGYNHRAVNWTTPKGRWNIGDRPLSVREKDYFLSLFRLCRGAASQLQFKDWAQNEILDVRFEGDEISFRFDAYDPDSEEAIYGLSGLPVVEVEAIIPQPYLYEPTELFNNLNPCFYYGKGG